ncbi:MAG TPA: YbjN domain-containing protein [Hansschlegelia sp.]
MALIDVDADRLGHPVDMIERIATLNDWSFDRSGDDEITISVDGSWTDYHVSLTWMSELESLHLACAFDLKVPDRRKTEILQLLTLVNEQMWLGHFDLWSAEGVVAYRHSLLLSGGAEASAAQCEAMLEAAIEACERHYQAFQFVLWAGKSAKEAMEVVAFETVGEA